MNPKLKKYQDASAEYVESEKLNVDVIGVIVTGSFVYSTIDKNSDIDIFVILDNNCDYRERGNTWINGIEVEYFKNSPVQIRSYFKKEKECHTAYMLALGKVVYQKSEIVTELISEAKEILNQELPKLSKIEIEIEKYFIDDVFKDFEDAIINNNFLGVQIIRNKLINRCIDVFCKFHQTRRTKDKRLSEQINKLDNVFNEKINLALSEKWNENLGLEQLKIATENLLGGCRKKEWVLRTKLDI